MPDLTFKIKNYILLQNVGTCSHSVRLIMIVSSPHYMPNYAYHLKTHLRVASNYSNLDTGCLPYSRVYSMYST